MVSRKKNTPSLDRINDLLKTSYTINQVINLIDKKVEIATTTGKQFLKQDLIPFIDNPLILDGYVDNFKNNYNQNKTYLNQL